MNYLKKALEGFKRAYSNEDTPIYGLDTYDLMYLIGELYRRTGEIDEAIKWFSNVIVSKGANYKTKDKARDMRDLAKEMKAVFEEEEDYVYIKKVIDILLEMRIIVHKDKEDFYPNKTVAIELTKRCNLHCIHCCIDAVQSSDEMMDLKTEEILEIIDKCIEWNPEDIMLSGGEPMLRKDFFEILQYLRNNYKGHITVCTNGTFINEDNVDMLCELSDQLDISLDGINEKTCSQVRGTGVFERVVENIKLVKSKNKNDVTISMVFSQKNEQLEEDFISLNKELGTKPICRGFSPVGRGKNAKDYYYSDEVYFPKEFLEAKVEETAACSCSAGNKELFIDFKGDIYPCPSFIFDKYKIANIKEVTSLNELTSNRFKGINTSLKVSNINPINNGKCKECNVNVFCWTCPGSYLYYENKDILDKECIIKKKVLTKRIWGE